MGFFEDQFNPDFWFDSEYKQRRDLRELAASSLDAELRHKAQAARVSALEARCDQLQLLCNALVSVIETKQLATREELEVLVQQLDLLDGREDGRMSGEAWAEAPRCAHCNHYVNPQREVCLYCGRSLALQGALVGGPYRGGAPVEAAPPPRTATCSGCGAVVPQAETYFDGDGALRCQGCYSGG